MLRRISSEDDEANTTGAQHRLQGESGTGGDQARAVSVRSTATRVCVAADGAVIAEHARRFGRGALICDPWHNLSLLERKPSALRNGVPFRFPDFFLRGCL